MSTTLFLAAGLIVHKGMLHIRQDMSSVDSMIFGWRT